jgi:NTP pyrophosphatase (non-canonical NTP hydrolase)
MEDKIFYDFIDLHVDENNTKYSSAIRKNSLGNNILYNTISLTGEVGEVANEIKKGIRNGSHTNDKEFRIKMIDELGDALYYYVALCKSLNISIEDIIEANIKKSKEKYGN